MKFVLRASFLATLGPVLAASLCARAQQPASAPPPRITSGIYLRVVDPRVVDPDGAGIPKVKITITDGNGENLTNGLTDRWGRFSVSQVPPGAYALNAEMVGFKPHNETVLVQEGRITELNLTLQVASIPGLAFSPDPVRHGESTLDLVVLDPIGAVIPTARAAVALSDGSFAEGVTDSRGALSIVGLPAGSHPFTVHANGFADFAGTVGSRAAKHVEITVKLTVMSYVDGLGPFNPSPGLLVEPSISTIEPELIPEPPPTAPSISSIAKPQVKSAPHGPLRRFFSTLGHGLGF